EPMRVGGAIGVLPLVKQASLSRLPPVDAPTTENVPVPPLPSVATAAVSVSTRRAIAPASNGDASAPSVLTAPVTPPIKPIEQPARKPAVPAAQRQIP